MVFVYVNRYLCEIKLHAWFSLNIYIFIVRAVIYMAWNEHLKSLTHYYEHIVMLCVCVEKRNGYTIIIEHI